MVVGREERGDLKLERSAKMLRIGGMKFTDLTVYSDRNDPKRRDIFVPGEADERFGDDLPDKATVLYLGNRYTATLSFRTGPGGSAIPVYQFRVSSKATT